MSESESEYIIHGTSYENLLNILKNGYIDNKPKESMGVYNKNPKQIFTQLVYYDIPSQQNEIPHWWTSAIVLDKQILKDYPFYATLIKNFKNKFKNGLINNNTNPKYDSNIFVRGKGKLNKIPRLTKLKTHISKHMTKKRPKMLDKFHDKFIYSHEILFNKKIPLDKYCKKIMILGKKNQYKNMQTLIDSIVNLAEERNIPLKFRDYKLKGNNVKPINNFINSIEEN
jgi:hypothetical protein